MLTILLAATAFSTTICRPDNSICVQSLLKIDDICFTVSSTFTGWTGIGIGSLIMDKAEMYIGYANSTGGTTVAVLEGSGHTVVRSDTVIHIVKGNFTSTTSKFVFAFCRPKQIARGQSISATKELIYAASNEKVPLPDVVSTNIPIHSIRGAFGNVNILDQSGNDSPAKTYAPDSVEPILKPSSSFSLQDVINLHGVMLWIAWVLSPIVGIFIARYAKDSMNHYWYTLHMAIMGTSTLILGFGGVSLVILYTTPPHFVSTHALVGIAITVITIVQVVLGFLSNHFFDPNRTFVPLLDKSHWWLGRALTLAGIANCQLGLSLYNTFFKLSSYFVIAHWSVLVGAIILFSIAEYKLGQINHVRQEFSNFYTNSNSTDENKRYI